MSSAWQTPPAPPRSGSPKWLWLVGGCAAVGMLGVFGACGFLVCMTGGHEGTVRYTNNMEEYATEYIERHGLLEPGERIVAYYDATFELNGSECAILTDRRLLYHRDGRSTSIALADIADVHHDDDPLLGDIIDVTGRDGSRIHVAIAPLSGGDGFLRALDERRRSGGLGYPDRPPF